MKREEIFTVIKTNMQKTIEGSKGKEILETNHMKDFGADSLEIVEVVSKSMKELKLRIPRTELAKAKDLKSLLDLFVTASTNPEVK